MPESWQREAEQNESFTAIPNEQNGKSGVESGNSEAGHELDEKFSAEICAMLLWALHEEFGFGADRLRRVWDCVAVHRAELLKHYDMQDNAEFILLYKLRQIGVDVEKWTAEPQTQKVVLKE